MLNQVRELVREECRNCKRFSSDVWNQHIVGVVKYSRMLAKDLGADQDLAELGALLHDIGSLRFGEDDHEITGQKEAEKILKDLGASKKIISEVKECVRSHRGSKDIKPKTLIAKIVANADAMAHFDVVPVLLRVGLDKYDKDEKLGAKWVWDKLERDWQKKLTIPRAKEMVKEKYRAAKLLLKP